MLITKQLDGITGDPGPHPGLEPRELLLAAPMSRTQVVAIVVTMALFALDGFDVLAITFAAPAVARDWGIGKAALGTAFSAGLVGMAAGSFLIAPLADVRGRRALTMFSLVLMIAGCLWTALTGGLGDLIASRLLTGLGVGTMIAVVIPLAAEYSNARRHDLAVSLLNIGYPVGGVAGGLLAAHLLPVHGWRTIFVCAAALGAAMLVISWLWLPEPVPSLIARPRRTARAQAAALAQVNAFLMRCGHAAVTHLPPPASRTTVPLTKLFRDGMTATTLKVTATYFLYVMTNFYLQTWVATLIANLGFPASQAAAVAVWVSLGGICGGLAVGALSGRIGLKGLAIAAQIGAVISIIALGFTPANLVLLRIASAVAGFFTLGAMIALYSVVARAFPAQMRASGTGFVVGSGRLGSALSPALAGLLFSTGLHQGAVSAVMAMPALLAAAVLLSYRVRSKTVD